MSIRQQLESDLKDLRSEVGSLAIQVAECSQKIGKIENQLAEIEDYELVDSISAAPAVVSSPEKPSNSGRGYLANIASPAPSTVSAEREDAARQTGRFFARCLEGLHRGPSGRSRVDLPNNYYVIVRTCAGKVHTDPVLVFKDFSSIRHLVKDSSGRLGSAIFAGFHTSWEAELAVSTAGFGWPRAAQ